MIKRGLFFFVILIFPVPGFCHNPSLYFSILAVLIFSAIAFLLALLMSIAIFISFKKEYKILRDIGKYIYYFFNIIFVVSMLVSLTNISPYIQDIKEFGYFLFIQTFMTLSFMFIRISYRRLKEPSDKNLSQVKTWMTVYFIFLFLVFLTYLLKIKREI